MAKIKGIRVFTVSYDEVEDEVIIEDAFGESSTNFRSCDMTLEKSGYLHSSRYSKLY